MNKSYDFKAARISVDLYYARSDAETFKRTQKMIGDSLRIE